MPESGCCRLVDILQRRYSCPASQNWDSRHRDGYEAGIWSTRRRRDPADYDYNVYRRVGRRGDVKKFCPSRRRDASSLRNSAIAGHPGWVSWDIQYGCHYYRSSLDIQMGVIRHLLQVSFPRDEGRHCRAAPSAYCLQGSSVSSEAILSSSSIVETYRYIDVKQII